MIRKEQLKKSGSPKVQVGEIDTSAPFQSVKDAVNLFGERAFTRGRSVNAIMKVKPHSAEKFAKDARLHLAGKELEELKGRLSDAKNSKAYALKELEKARQTAEDLNQKIKSINEAKEAALKATEAEKIQAKQLEKEANHRNLVLNNADLQQDLISLKEQHMKALEELNTVKQELTKLRWDYDASLEAKVTATKQVEDAENQVKTNKERAQDLSKEVLGVKETIEQVHKATTEAKRDITKIFEEKDVQRQTYNDKSHVSIKKLQAMKSEFDPELIKHLETQLADKMSEISRLQKEMDDVKASDLEIRKAITLGLEREKEESVLRDLVDSLKFELETLRKEHAELRMKETEIESVAGNLHIKLRKEKSELEICLTAEAKARGPSEEMEATLNQILAESESTRQESEKLKIMADELEKGAEATRASLQESKKLLTTTIEEASQAKACEESALEQIKIISKRINTVRSSISESGAKINLSRNESESIRRKEEELRKLTVLKVAAATAQVEAVKASQDEAVKKMEATQKEIGDMDVATEEALKRVEMAMAAKKAIEGELIRWREKEQKKADETASRRVIDENLVTALYTTHQVSSAKSSPTHTPIRKQKSEIPIGSKKMEDQRSSLSRIAMKPSFSGIFQKKNQIDAGSPSYPGKSPFF